MTIATDLTSTAVKAIRSRMQKSQRSEMVARRKQAPAATRNQVVVLSLSSAVSSGASIRSHTPQPTREATKTSCPQMRRKAGTR